MKLFRPFKRPYSPYYVHERLSKVLSGCIVAPEDLAKAPSSLIQVLDGLIGALKDFDWVHEGLLKVLEEVIFRGF